MIGGRLTGTGAQIAFLAVLAAYFMVWPVWRLGFPIEIAQNEGWNAYHADAAGFFLHPGAGPLYPATDTLIVNNYPPLSFYVVGGLAQLSGIDALYVGRVMSVLAVGALAGLIAAVVRQLGGGGAGAAFGGLWFVAVMARSFARFVGMNDPQLAGHVLMMAALAWFLSREARGRSAVPPVLAMAAAGFYKHNIIAVPVTALAWLALTDWRRAVWPAIAGAGAAALGLAICAAVYGDVFFSNLLTARPSSIMRAINGLGRLQFILPALVLWGIWAAVECQSRAARFTMLFVAVGFAAFVAQWSGEAILDNAQFDLAIAAAAGVRADAARVAAIPGPVACDFKVVCRMAGKPFVYDDFRAEMLVATGQSGGRDVDGLIRAHGLTRFSGDPHDGIESLFRAIAGKP